MISIQLNEQTLETSENISLAEFLNQQNNMPTCFAIVINQQFIPKSLYQNTILKPSDQIELITPMQGG